MAIWPAAGVGLAALLLSPRRLWLPILVALFVAGYSADLLAGRSPVSSVGFVIANLLESLSCAWCMTRWCGERIRFVRIKEISALVFAAMGLNALTACLGAGAATLTHAAPFFTFWLSWWISDGLGILLVTPAIVTLLRADGPRWGVRRERAAEGLLFMLLWGVVAWMVFEPRSIRMPPHPYMLLALITWPAFRLGGRTVSLSLLVLAVIAIVSKTVVSGPSIWGGTTPEARLLDIQMFLGCAGVVSYYFSASITEVRSAMDALSQSEQRFRVITAGSPDQILVQDRNLRFTFVLNPRFGLSEKDFIGKTEHDVLAKEDADRLVAIKTRVMESGQPVHMAFPLVANGKAEYLDGSYAPSRAADGSVNGVIGYFRNVTEKRQMEAKYRSLFNNAEVGMFRTRLDGSELLDFNDKYLEIFGRTREEMVGSHAVDHWAEPAERAAMVEKLKADGHVLGFECRMLTKSGEVKTCLTSIRLYQDQGILEGSVVDITERKRAEAERLNLEQQLSQAQRLESLGLLAGGIAHDFNNLMSAIYAHIELALDSPLDKDAADNLSTAMASMGRARDLTRQLLTFAKGGAPVRKVGRLFPFVEESARFALSGGRATCTFDVAPDLWACNFDENQMGQVIGNLMINAQQAMPGVGAIRISARNIRLAHHEAAALPAGHYLMVAVEDNGMGISAETLPRIFDPFFTTKEQGRGLGLSTCHSIMRRHDGAITADSTPGQGSTFRLYLPAVCSPGDLLVLEAPTEQHRGSGRVLVMDDERSIRDVLSASLTSLGYSVETVGDGCAAVEMFAQESRAGRPFSAVLLDLTVPGGLGGKEAAPALRALDPSASLFVTSGYAEDPVMANPVDYGFTASLRKPFAKSELAQLLGRHLKRGEPSSESAKSMRILRDVGNGCR